MSTASIQNPLVIRADITADATAGITYTVTRPGFVLDAHAICTAANALGTITVRKAAAAITSAIVCAVDTTLARTTIINDANYSFAAGNSMVFITNGAADRGIAVVQFVPAGLPVTIT